MGKVSERGKEGPDDKQVHSESEEEDEEDDDDESIREDTPDLYRNSALGM